MGVGDAAGSLQDGNLPLLHPEHDTFPQLGNHPVFPGMHRGKITGWFSVDNAEDIRLPEGLHEFRCMQQGFGGNAAAVQACPAHLVLFHQSYAHFRGSGQRCLISAGPRADHHQIKIKIRHMFLLFYLFVILCSRFSRSSRTRGSELKDTEASAERIASGVNRIPCRAVSVSSAHRGSIASVQHLHS